MPRYNHAFTIAFEVKSNHPNGDDITSDMFKNALIKRAKEISETGVEHWFECTGSPFDSFEEDDNPSSKLLDPRS